MKGNNGTGNTTDRDDWETPNKLIYTLDNQYNFTFDCCASIYNHKFKQWSDNFLEIETTMHPFKIGVCWINPPFSKAKEMIEHFFKVVKKGVGIYRIDNIETQIWFMILNKADWVHIFNKRINYEGHEGKGARFGSALFGVGVPPPKNLEGTTINKLNYR